MIQSILRPLHKALIITMTLVIGLHLSPLVALAGVDALKPYHHVKTIDRANIRLSDLFPRLGSVPDQTIGLAPAPGQDMTLNARTLMRLASAYGIDWRPQTTADQVSIRRDGVIITPDQIKAALDKNIADTMPGQYETTPLTPIGSITLPAGSEDTLQITEFRHHPQTQTVTAKIMPIGNTARAVAVTARLTPMVEVPVLRTAITRGTTITAEDIDMTRMAAPTLKGDVVTTADAMIGKTAKRSINPGLPIKATDIALPVVVARGDKVTLVYRVGSMELAALGRTLQEGRVGDRVNVVNVTSNQSLQGTISPDNRIIID